MTALAWVGLYAVASLAIAALVALLAIASAAWEDRRPRRGRGERR